MYANQLKEECWITWSLNGVQLRYEAETLLPKDCQREPGRFIDKSHSRKSVTILSTAAFIFFCKVLCICRSNASE